ncbi:YdcH family protein [Methylocapsa acidiphila]|uniref:YdcH family protein n=1 Tax=Methylocapsa acidiphila TaxID=133552 RepID=UPI00041CE38B|nr:YdcH family protein [Methylocapsa acidiphila]
MSHVAHELHEEFPDKVEAIKGLKGANAHFARIAEEYHEVNRTIHRMEAEVEPTDDATLEALKKQRLSLKDQIAQILLTA